MWLLQIHHIIYIYIFNIFLKIFWWSSNRSSFLHFYNFYKFIKWTLTEYRYRWKCDVENIWWLIFMSEGVRRSCLYLCSPLGKRNRTSETPHASTDALRLHQVSDRDWTLNVRPQPNPSAFTRLDLDFQSLSIRLILSYWEPLLD